MKRRFEFECDDGKRYFLTVEAATPTLNRLFVILANHREITCCEQYELHEQMTRLVKQ